MTSDPQRGAGARTPDARGAVGLAGDRARRLAPLLVLLAAAAALLFTDLGGPWLWEDEADTALFARAIVRDGLPTAWDGRSFVDSDDGMRVAPHALGHDFVLVGTPWLPYYVAAASFALFGESEWAARLPFALVALATVAALYGLVLRTTGSARAAFAAGLLLLASAQFLLFGREARSYAPNMLLTVVLLAGFLRLGERRRDPWLAVAAVLLFYVQVLPVAVALAACAGLALLHPAFRSRLPALLARAPFVAALTLAWLLLAWSGTRANWEPLGSAAEWPRRIGQLAAEASVAVPALGWAIGLPLVRRRLGPGDRTLLALCAAWLVACAALAPLALSASLLEVVGLRYVCGMLPVAAAVSGVLVARASGRSAAAYAAVLALFAATQLAGSALPWLALGHSRRLAGVAVSVPRDLGAKLFNVPWWAFVRGLGAPDAGTLHPLVGLLRERAARDDVVLTNFGWDGLYYYSDLALGMRIDPSAPVYAHARRRELPRYVFDVDDADWIVWRGGNEAFLGYPFLLLGQPLEALRARLAVRGARLELVAELPETLWENRPELFWHRFPGLGHPFAPPRLGARGPRYRDARVFRVSWPAEAARTAAPTPLPGAPPATTDAAPTS